MEYHVEQQHGPPSLFLTFSCAENHWGTLANILADRIEMYDKDMATKLRNRNFSTMCEAARDHPLVVAEFFQIKLETWLATVGKEVFKIKHHWGAYEFAKGRGVIHVHLLAICDNLEILNQYHKLKGNKKEQEILMARYAREELFMTTEHPGTNLNEIASPEGTAQKDSFMYSVQELYSECRCVKKDIVNIINSLCMHFCNDYCLRYPHNNKKDRYVYNLALHYIPSN